MLKSCTVCKGGKRILGIGGMIKDCYHCGAVGWIEDSDDMVDDVLTDAYLASTSASKVKELKEPIVRVQKIRKVRRMKD